MKRVRESFARRHVRVAPVPGSAQGRALAPHLFDAEWYAWQNPDCLDRCPDAFSHYLERGRFEGRDPSPMIDMTRFREMTGGMIPSEDALAAIQGGLASPALGVYRNWSDLTVVQRAFTADLGLHCHRLGMGPRRPYLVFLQCGRASLHRKWMDQARRDWDLLVNYYDPEGFDPELGEHVFFQPGTKFTAMARLMRSHPELLMGYEAVLFLDDDISFAPDAPDRLFAAMARDGVDLAQMSLAAGSHCTWPQLFSQGGAHWRKLNAVEIMMPALSRRALRRVHRDLGLSVSGFGLDLLWGRQIATMGGVAAVHDGLIARHARPIDDRSGAYYSYLRSHQINPKAELWRIITRHGTGREIAQISQPFVAA